MAHKSSVPLFWRLQKAKYSLLGSKCLTCGSVFFPPKTLCPNCRRKGKIEEHKLSGNGKIVSYTTIHVPPENFDAPYTIAIIELDEGTRISGQIVNPEGIKIGSRVRPVFRRIMVDGDEGLIHYGIKWETDGDAAGSTTTA